MDKIQAKFNKNNDKIDLKYGEKDAMIILTFEKNNIECLLSNVDQTDLKRAIFLLRKRLTHEI